MADVRPFRGLHYNPAKVQSLSDVITPPYDVISEQQKQKYLNQSPWNVVRIILPDGSDPYLVAKQTLGDWIRQEVLIRDLEPAVYCYHQTFKTPDGQERTRKGFMAIVRLEEFDKGTILPHEATLVAPKEDRLRLLRSCECNFCPIFGLYSDSNHRVDRLLDPLTEAPPRFKVDDDTGVTNALWSIKDPDVLQEIQTQMKEHWVLIADGHHRYEACLIYRNEKRQQNSDPEMPWNFTLMFFSNINHSGITILPYNRAVLNLPNFDPNQLVERAREFFDVTESDNFQDARNSLATSKETPAFLALMAGRTKPVLFRLRQGLDISRFYSPGTPKIVQLLDVNILHKILLTHVAGITEEDIQQQKYLKYYKDLAEEKRDFEQGKLQIAFFLNPTRVEQVVEVSKAGIKMPQKSTYFYPKVMTGFVINQHS